MKFFYKARTKEGIAQKGMIEASTRQAALDILGKYGLFATSLKDSSQQAFFSKSINLRFGSQISKKDLVIFTRQLATMLKSAIPPLKAFRAQVAQTNNSDFREKVLRMAEALETGNSLSQVFSLFPKAFGPFYINIVKGGEATGKVADALNYLADHLEREYQFNQKIKSALMYPAFVVMVFFGSFGIVVFFIVPRLSEILKNFEGGDMPLLTRLLIKLADFIAGGGWILAPILLIPLIILPIFIARSPQAKHFYHKWSLKAPMIGDVYRKVYVSRFAENLSVLVRAGLPITQALRISGQIISNSIYKELIFETEKRVSRGEKISAFLTSHPREFPPFVTQMISTGEETGQLDQTLMDLVRFYQADVERSTEKMTTLLEPIMILILGLGIALLAFAVFIPLFNMGLGGA